MIAIQTCLRQSSILAIMSWETCPFINNEWKNAFWDILDHYSSLFWFSFYNALKIAEKSIFKKMVLHVRDSHSNSILDKEEIILFSFLTY